MQRRTVTIDEDNYRWLQSLRAKFLEDNILDEMSFTTAINLVLRGGILATDKLDEHDWELLWNFLQEKGETLELDSLTDRSADHYLRNLQRWGQQAES